MRKRIVVFALVAVGNALYLILSRGMSIANWIDYKLSQLLHW